MIVPLQITFRHMDPSPALEAHIRELAARLDKFSEHLVRCRVIVEPQSRRAAHGALYAVRIVVRLPDLEIATRRSHPAARAHEDPYVALRDAFRATRRKLEDYERTRRLDVKRHVGPARGRVCALDSAHDCGRIATEDGRLIYFHRNSVLGSRFQDLTTGTRVRFAEECGDLGPQASTVHVVP